MNWSCPTYVLMLVISVYFCGCGEDETSEIAKKHNRICETEIVASNCPDDLDLTGMVLFCKAASEVFFDTDICNAKMDVYVACNRQRTWACADGWELPVPERPDSCDSAIVESFTLPNGECVDQTKLRSN